MNPRTFCLEVEPTSHYTTDSISACSDVLLAARTSHSYSPTSASVGLRMVRVRIPLRASLEMRYLLRSVSSPPSLPHLAAQQITPGLGNGNIPSVTAETCVCVGGGT